MFTKTGSPQPIKVASTECQQCGETIAVCLKDGKMLCNSCRKEIESKE